MKKKNDSGKSMLGRIYTVAAITLAIIALVMIIAVTISIFAPRERTSKAQEYDLNCVTELRKKPLNECRKEK